MQCHALCLFIIHKKCYEIKYKIGNAENLNTEVIYIILLENSGSKHINMNLEAIQLFIQKNQLMIPE